MEDGCLLEITHLVRRFDSKVALDDVSMEVGRGEIVGLLGPNGSGKTTLHRIVCTLLEPDGGSVRVDGFDILTHGAQARGRLGVVLQEPSLDAILTVEENIDFYGRLHGVPKRVRAQRLAHLVEILSLGGLLKQPIRKLSWGQKRRVEIARGLLPQPSLFLLDEPGAALDPMARRELWSHLVEVNRQHGTALFVSTHNVDEAVLCHRIVILRDGRVAEEGDPRALLRQHDGVDLTEAFRRLIHTDEGGDAPCSASPSA